MAAIPLGKILYMALKQVSRPISRRMIALSRKSNFFKNYICLPPANAYNWLVTMVRVRFMGSQTKIKVLPLNEDKAIQLGSELMGELIVFIMSACILLAEYKRQSRSAQTKEKEQNRRIESLREEITALKQKVDTYDEKLEYFAQLQTENKANVYKSLSQTLNRLLTE